MNAESTTSSSLRIRRFRINCLVPNDHPSPEQVRARLTEATEKLLPGTLASALHPAFPETDSSLWFIRRLDLAADLNVAWDRERLAQSLAVCTARSLCAELGSLVGGANVIRFNGPAEYLATFLCNLADGQAWGNWYYNRFDGLRMLPTSAALRTALCDDAATGLEALHQMPLPVLKQILSEMTNSDAERVLQTLAEIGTAGSEEDCYQITLPSVEKLTCATLGHLGKARAALLLYVDATRDAGSQIGYQVAAAAQTVVSFIQCAEDKPVPERRRLFVTLNNRDKALLYQSAGPAYAEKLAPLLRLSDSLLSQILDAVIEPERVKVSNDNGSPTVRTTTFGGVFFLLPLIDELPLAEVARSLPDADGIDPETIIRWVVLVKCFGETNSRAVVRDPLIQELAGLPPSFLSRELLLQWQRKIMVRQIEELLGNVIQWRWNNQTVGGRICVLAQIYTNGQRLAVMLDASRGCWLFSTGLLGGEDKLLIRALQRLSFSPELVVCQKAYGRIVREVLPKTNTVDLHDLTALKQSEYAEEARSVLTGLPRLHEQLSYFSLPKEFGLSSRLDRALTVMAHGVLCDFAWRLPGFSWSQPAYLAENFLNCSATIEEESDRSVVRLSRPPLDVLLNMTGINRRQYQLSWLGGQKFELYPDHA